ncbi:hypothetical protein RhiirC2_820663 [Rhizophagus irregularis]|uniref:Uncharacterized protein n=1 Tax=Rhizophagus irregularis TaxID=588596 RepID=A0A2N1MD74_9GLOM|nr:hypothetical protein RhiirC2_820663 [Rhizophagus irregularis]
MINKWRLNDGTTPEQTEILEQTSHSSIPNKVLRKDNVAPDEVVKIINEHRQMKKIEYVHYNTISGGSKGYLTAKLDELQSIFEQLDSAMEWKKINTQAVSEITDSLPQEELTAIANGSPSKKSFFIIGRRVISLAEQNDIIRLYTTLNDGFEQRLKDENRYQEDKKVGQKRPIFDSPMKSESEPSDTEDSESDSEEVKPYVLEPEKEEGSTRASKNTAVDKKKKKKKKKNYRK